MHNFNVKKNDLRHGTLSYNILRCPLQSDAKKEELLKPTNPAAQKAALSQTTQYKVSPRPTAKIKPRPIHSLANGKVLL